MNLDNILAQLKQQRNSIDAAIAALDGLSQSTNGVGRSSAIGRRGGRRRMSTAGRKRLSELVKKRWVEGSGPRQLAKELAKAKKAPRHMPAKA